MNPAIGERQPTIPRLAGGAPARFRHRLEPPRWRRNVWEIVGWRQNWLAVWATSLRPVTEPQQKTYVWNKASDYGSFYYQNFFLNANNTGQPGTFAPGSLTLGNALPAYGYAPQTLPSNRRSASDFTFLGGPGINGMDPNLKQPYTHSWNLGIQRQIGQSAALEIRYVGNRTLRQWMSVDPNEINIFENGFLTQFKAAQQNLAANNFPARTPTFTGLSPTTVWQDNKQHRFSMPHLPARPRGQTERLQTTRTPVSLLT